MDEGSKTEPGAGVSVRSYRPEDRPAVSRLYTEGLLEGQIAANDTGADIENIAEAYLSAPENHFWVAERDGEVLGMIGVAREEEHLAEIRRLRVHPSHQQTGIAAELMRTALSHCRHHGYLKVVLDTRFTRNSVLEIFDRFGFQHTRSKNMHGKELLEFYLDLYRQRKDELRRETD
jgi:putative acetyltransferase